MNKLNFFLVLLLTVNVFPGSEKCLSQNAFSREGSEKDLTSGLKLPQGFYPVLPWDFYNSRHPLKDISDCNFNLSGFIKPREIGQAETLGLKVIVDLGLNAEGFNRTQKKWLQLTDQELDEQMRILIEKAGHSDAILGYYIMDEPSASHFSYLAKAVKAVQKYAPGKLAYINLFPDYATLWSLNNLDSQLGTTSYTEYLERYVQEVKPQFISYDNYMVQYSMDLKDKKKALSYYKNLLEVRRIAIKYNLPYWNIVSSHQIRSHTTIPSPANMLFQAYTSLAAGYNGISWYQFNQNNYNYSPLDSNYVKTLTWHALKEVNRQILTLGPVINRSKSAAVFFNAPAPDPSFDVLPGEIVDSLICDGPLMIGEFSGGGGARLAMVVNLSLDRSVRFTLSTKSGRENIYLISPSANDSFIPVITKTDLNGHRKDYWLTAGSGVLLRFGD